MTSFFEGINSRQLTTTNSKQFFIDHMKKLEGTLVLIHPTKVLNFVCLFNQFLNVLCLLLGSRNALLNEAWINRLTSGFDDVTDVKLTAISR